MAAFGVIGTVVTVTGLAEADLVLHGNPPVMRPIIGGALLGIFLYALSELNGRLGTLFGILIIVNSLIDHGGSVFDALNGKQVKK